MRDNEEGQYTLVCNDEDGGNYDDHNVNDDDNDDDSFNCIKLCIYYVLY